MMIFNMIITVTMISEFNRQWLTAIGYVILSMVNFDANDDFT